VTPGLACLTSGLPDTVWGAAVPNNYAKRVRDLVEEVHRDHDHMVRLTARSAVRKGVLLELGSDICTQGAGS
jgi:hypothetical protein